MKHRIALDFDDTLSATNQHWVESFNYPFKVEDIYDWDIWSDFGITLQKFLKETRSMWKNNWKDIPLIDEGYKNIDCLDVPVDIVTARPQPEYIAKWLEFHDIPYEKLIVMPGSPYKYLTGHDIYIDDFPFMHNYLLADQFQILIDRPWNQSVQQDFRNIRVKGFDEAVQVIENQAELSFYKLNKNGTRWC